MPLVESICRPFRPAFDALILGRNTVDVTVRTKLSRPPPVLDAGGGTL
jgi:hypothetical protein